MPAGSRAGSGRGLCEGLVVAGGERAPNSQGVILGSWQALRRGAWDGAACPGLLSEWARRVLCLLPTRARLWKCCPDPFLGRSVSERVKKREGLSLFPQGFLGASPVGSPAGQGLCWHKPRGQLEPVQWYWFMLVRALVLNPSPPVPPSCWSRPW